VLPLTHSLFKQARYFREIFALAESVSAIAGRFDSRYLGAVDPRVLFTLEPRTLHVCTSFLSLSLSLSLPLSLSCVLLNKSHERLISVEESIIRDRGCYPLPSSALYCVEFV